MYTEIDYRKIRFLFFTFSHDEYSFTDTFAYFDIGDCPGEEDEELLDLINEISKNFSSLFNVDTDIILAFLEFEVKDGDVCGIYAMEDKTIVMRNRNLEEAIEFESYKDAITNFRQILDKCDGI